MEAVFEELVERCLRAIEEPEPQRAVAAVLRTSMSDPVLAEAVSRRTVVTDLSDLTLHRSDRLTVIAGSLPPHFQVGPHNHNLWSVVGVASGREDNRFFEVKEAGLELVGETSVLGPGILANDAEAIHAIANPLDTPLLVVHAYGGDLFTTPRSSWILETGEEIPYDWRRTSGVE